MHHALNVVRAGRARGGEGACGRSCAAAQHGGDAAGQRFLNLLGRNKVNVGVNAPSGHNHAFAADDFSAGANDDVNAGLGVWVASFADGCNAIAFEANVSFHNAPVVNDEGIGEHAIHGAFCIGALRLRHAIANGFAATKLHFFAVATGLQSEIFFYLNNQVGVGQANSVTHSGAKHFCISAFVDVGHVRKLSGYCRQAGRWSVL